MMRIFEWKVSNDVMLLWAYLCSYFILLFFRPCFPFLFLSVSFTPPRSAFISISAFHWHPYPIHARSSIAFLVLGVYVLACISMLGAWCKYNVTGEPICRCWMSGNNKYSIRIFLRCFVSCALSLSVYFLRFAVRIWYACIIITSFVRISTLHVFLRCCCCCYRRTSTFIRICILYIKMLCDLYPGVSYAYQQWRKKKMTSENRCVRERERERSLPLSLQKR